MRRARFIALLILVVAAAAGWWLWSARAANDPLGMPGKSFRGPPPPLTPDEVVLRDELARHVQKLAGEIGERNVPHYAELQAAADYIEQSFTEAGYRPRRDGYEVEGRRCDNIEAEIAGTSSQIVVIGAHYDSVYGSPGANDNGSGVAALLALARRFAGKPAERTLRFVAFPNEEPGYFQSEQMGSWVYAKRCKHRGDNIVAMISLETIGYFSDAPGSQVYPLPGLGAIYPKTGNFIGFVSNIGSRKLLRQALGAFRKHAHLPSEGAALPSGVPGVAWSDHWAFWQHGYPAIMITDTAPFRYPHYHARSDTPDKLKYEPMARLVSGFGHVVDDLVGRR